MTLESLNAERKALSRKIDEDPTFQLWCRHRIAQIDAAMLRLELNRITCTKGYKADGNNLHDQLGADSWLLGA